jgi:hypothetical protein
VDDEDESLGIVRVVEGPRGAVVCRSVAVCAVPSAPRSNRYA